VGKLHLFVRDYTEIHVKKAAALLWSIGNVVTETDIGGR
jgi:hypothetical protein